MFDVGASLQVPLDAARSALHRAQADVAVAGTGVGGRASNAAMAEAARAAMFTEALLSAEHARLEEIKGVAR